MSNEIQEGIYYRSKPAIGNSFSMISMRTENVAQISEIGVTLAKLWENMRNLKNGSVTDLAVDSRHRKGGGLTVLVAYGFDLFKIPGSQKDIPVSFNNIWNFKSPDSSGGGVILDGAGLTYSGRTFSNHLLKDHVILQFIAENEFFTHRAAVETWKELYRQEKANGSAPLRITGLYTGFQRGDKRNWLGFHDGVSNIKSQERSQVITIGSRYLKPQDRWTVNGTYLAFMRIIVNLEKWENLSIPEQEILIGRDKITGCPIVRVEKNGKPVKDPRCPVPGTSEVIDRGNEYFREHPPYGIRPGDKLLEHSHIGLTNPREQIPIGDKRSLRIYRQGFEFLTTSSKYPGFIPGLNFVSFQNTPERLFRALTYQQTRFQNSHAYNSLPNLNQFMSVLAAGIFFVPPTTHGEPFPGAEIFFKNTELRNLSSDRW
jgi:deferrochelatase/peroxidase EfeB